MRMPPIGELTMNPDKEKDKKYTAEKIEEYLARGGVITQCPPCTTSETVEYKHKFGRGRPKKKTEEKE